MLYAVEGEGELDTGKVLFRAGSLAFYQGDEELRVVDVGASGLTLLAFLLRRSHLLGSSERAWPRTRLAPAG